MCRPDYFSVSYSINPWMNPQSWQSNASQDVQSAITGWEAMYEKFLSLGVAIRLVEAQPGLPDMVFAANSAVVLDRKAIFGRFLHPERQGEEKHYAEFFKRLKAAGDLDDLLTLPEDIIQEGAGDCSWDADRQLFWVGYGQRSSKQAAHEIESYFGKRVIALELASPEFYHIDVSLSPLSGGQVMYYPKAFTQASLKKILEIVLPKAESKWIKKMHKISP